MNRGRSDIRVASEAWLEFAETVPGGQAIDSRTWEDLTLDAVHSACDGTHTALGSQALYWRLRSGEEWGATPFLEDLTARFNQDPALRQRVGYVLATAGRGVGPGLWFITQPEAIQLRWWYWFFPAFAIGMLASIVTVFIVPAAIFAVFGFVMINLLVRVVTYWQVPGLLAPMRQLGPLISTTERLLDSVGATFGTPAHARATVARLRPLARLSLWVSRDNASSGELISGAWEYLNLLFILDANALLFGARRLRTAGPLLKDVARWVGDVDLALAVASIRASNQAWTVPDRTDPLHTRIEGAWHPLVADAVRNHADLVPGSGVIITGANMSGKSTYLRTVGIAAVLARAIGTAPAASWHGTCFRVRSLIGRGDDLLAGKSYYQVEVDTVVSMLVAAQSEVPTLFLLDELLHGTNTIERLAAGEAVLRALLTAGRRPSPHVVLVATHDGELVDRLRDLYTPFHFRETVCSDGRIHFEYHRQPGPATSRTAIALLEATGAPPSVVQSARAFAVEYEAARLIHIEGDSSSSA